MPFKPRRRLASPGLRFPPLGATVRILSGGTLAAAMPCPLTSACCIETRSASTHDRKSAFLLGERTGAPQVYQVAVNCGRFRRLTSNGSDNVRPTFYPDGGNIGDVSQRGDQDPVIVHDLTSATVRTPGFGPDDAHPSFASSGSFLGYSIRKRGFEVLKSATLSGDIRSPLQLDDRLNMRRSPVGGHGLRKRHGQGFTGLCSCRRVSCPV